MKLVRRIIDVILTLLHSPPPRHGKSRSHHLLLLPNISPPLSYFPILVDPAFLPTPTTLLVGFGSAGNRKSTYYIRRQTPPVIGVRWDVLGSMESHMRSPHANKTDQGYVVAPGRRVKEGCWSEWEVEPVVSPCCRSSSRLSQRVEREWGTPPLLET